MSLVDEQHEWGAKRVRETFLEYFKKNGHTFGACSFLTTLYSTGTV
jgi:alanyl-tRNA synthetase